MANKIARGMKRKCQNVECEIFFYDLNRQTFSCPTCGTPFDPEAQVSLLEQQAGATPHYPRRRQARELPIVPSPDTAKYNANDNNKVVEGELDDVDVSTKDDPIEASAADDLLEEDEGTQGSTLDIVSLSLEDDEEA